MSGREGGSIAGRGAFETDASETDAKCSSERQPRSSQPKLAARRLGAPGSASRRASASERMSFRVRTMPVHQAPPAPVGAPWDGSDVPEGSAHAGASPEIQETQNGVPRRRRRRSAKPRSHLTFRLPKQASHCALFCLRPPRKATNFLNQSNTQKTGGNP